MLHYRYFSNKECEFYKTCHNGAEKNCLFCYCPLYTLDCKGDYVLLKNGLKDCSACMKPHTPEGYDYVMSFLMRKK